MRLYRVVATARIRELLRNGIETDEHDGIPEPRTYFWGRRGEARKWELHLVACAKRNQERSPKLSIIVAEVPDLFIREDDDTNPVLEEIGRPYYVRIWIPPGSIVFHRVLR